METVFDAHAHYLFPLPIEETVRIFREEFAETGTEKVIFLSIPKEYNTDGSVISDITQNIKGLYLKKAFFPDAYAFAGLMHPETYSDIKKVALDFRRQAEAAIAMGFDGFKMLEGYPTFRKYTGVSLDNPVFDEFYTYCETANLPITLHVANPDENWDIAHASKHAIEQGRVYDGSYLSKEEQTEEVFRVLQKHPRLRLALAHCGFFSQHYENAIRFMDGYPNTVLDITPGGEQLITMAQSWDRWLPFIKKHADRIIYGTDYYAFPKENEAEWRTAFTRRPTFLRQFFETDTEHLYLDQPFRGVALPPPLRRKIYYDNALRLFGTPREIDTNSMLRACCSLLMKPLTPMQKEDVTYIMKSI